VAHVRYTSSGIMDWVRHLLAGFSAADAAAFVVPTIEGDSGDAGTGISLAANYVPTFCVRQVYIEGAGNFKFDDAAGNMHLLAVDAKTWVRSIVIAKVYSAANGTTATGVHLF
jgi:hypothetical protein